MLWHYFAANKVEIRVGKQAEDNDELSINPEHHDGSDWWMHASGCPGSHVVIRCANQSLPEELVMDAAALAARQSLPMFLHLDFASFNMVTLLD